MTLEEIRKDYENSPNIVKIFNTLIDVVISNYYQSKDIYDESVELNTIRNINFSIKPEIKLWHVDLIENEMTNIIQKTHYDWENNFKLHEKFESEFDYLCSTMAKLKKFIHTPAFLKIIGDYVDRVK